MFFVDLEGRAGDAHVQAGLRALREHAEVVRVIGSFPAAPRA
jgi:prephenate dehydratase